MIVCNCRGASDRDVRAAIQRGAACLSELERCGIGGDCGGCEEALLAMIAGASQCDGASRRFWSAVLESGRSSPPHSETAVIPFAP